MLGYGVLGMALMVAALLGQREAQVILFLWITWPILRVLLRSIPKAIEVLRKREKEDTEVVEAKVDVWDVWEDNSHRRALPRSTRPELPDPDVVDTEWRALPAPSAPRWKMVFATAIALLGGLLFLIGFVGFLTTLLR
jgi:hypothetical protein